MNPRIFGQLGMEGCHGDRPLTAQYGLTVDRRQHFDRRVSGLDDRCSDKNSVERLVETLDYQIALERGELTTVTISPDRDRYCSEAVLVGPTVENLGGQQDHAGTSAKCRQARVDPLAHRIEHGEPLEQHRHCGRLAAGDNQGIDSLELGDGADLDGVHPERLEDPNVGGKRALQRQYPYCRGHQPRSANFVSSDAISRPFMASPSPVETFTRMSGSR